MRRRLNESMDTVFDCVIPYIHDGDDRNSLSLVCRKWCELEGMTRKHVTVHLFYSPKPSRLFQRFPFLESLTLKGPAHGCPERSIDINPWIQEIAVSFNCLKGLHISHMDVHDSDLELLATTRGKDLRVLKIIKSRGFSTDGLLHIGKYCNDLRTLCLIRNGLHNKDGKWFHELALQNTGIESLDFRYFLTNTIDTVKDLTLLAKNCSQSLVSLKIAGFSPSNLVDIFRYAVRLEDCFGITWVDDLEHNDLKFSTSMRCMGIYYLTESSVPFVLPFGHQIRELHLIHELMDASKCLLFQSCPNLEVFYTGRGLEDTALQVIGEVCKKLRKFKNTNSVSLMGLLTMVKGCLELECLRVRLRMDVSNEFFECIGTHLKNLRDFDLTLGFAYIKTSLPLDDGIRAMLIGCSKLERLSIYLEARPTGLTDVGLGYIGKYGHNLRFLYLGYAGESDAGLVELSKGCPKLRKLEMVVCPFSEQAISTFVFNIHSLRYVWTRDANYDQTMALTRPNS